MQIPVANSLIKEKRFIDAKGRFTEKRDKQKELPGSSGPKPVAAASSRSPTQFRRPRTWTNPVLQCTLAVRWIRSVKIKI